jgi:hypothetical protein
VRGEEEDREEGGREAWECGRRRRRRGRRRRRRRRRRGTEEQLKVCRVIEPQQNTVSRQQTQLGTHFHSPFSDL